MLDEIKIRRTINIDIDKKINDILSLIPSNSLILYKVDKAEIINNGVIDKNSIHTTEEVFNMADIDDINSLISKLREDIISSNTMYISISENYNTIISINKKELLSFVSNISTKEYLIRNKQADIIQ